MRIVSTRIGQPRRIPDPALPAGFWTTATFKEPVDGPIRLTVLGLEGDSQADQINHGGPDKAALAYGADYYPLWREELSIPGFGDGSLGENLTIGGVLETDIAIGDRYAIGDAIVEVSQPRKPCWKQARRWGINDLVPRMVDAGRTGWYLRVLQEGTIQTGMDLILLARPSPEWTIAAANAVYHAGKHDLLRTRQLSEVPSLSESWKQALRARLSQ